MKRYLSDRLSAFGAVLGKMLPDAGEAGLLTALGLIAAGCWFVWRPAAALVPGVILLWIYLPQRRLFIERPSMVTTTSTAKRES